MKGNNRLIKPGSVNVETTHSPGPLAQPAMVTMQSPDGIKVLTLGGLTKVEALAGQIYAGLLLLAMPGSSGFCETFDATVVRSVVTAEAILAECERRRNEPTQEQSQGGADEPQETQG
jgi:hypothetical protein